MREKQPPHTPQTTAPAAVEPPKALVQALRRVLRPLVKLLLSFQVTYPYLAELLKSVYVEVAERDFPLDDKKQTDTRISLLTGVHRKDTKRLRQTLHEGTTTPETVSVGAQLVARWISDEAFLDEKGQPRPLSLKDTASSFESLVQLVCKQDMRARVVLDEWLRLGVASLNERGEVVLNQSAFVPRHGVDEKAYYFGMNVADHLAAVSHNLLDQQPPMLERCVYYSGLSDDSVAELKQIAEARGMETLTALNARARELQKADLERGNATQRINIGLYLHHEQKQSDPSSLSADREA